MSAGLSGLPPGLRLESERLSRASTVSILSSVAGSSCRCGPVGRRLPVAGRRLVGLKRAVGELVPLSTTRLLKPVG